MPDAFETAMYSVPVGPPPVDPGPPPGTRVNVNVPVINTVQFESTSDTSPIPPSAQNDMLELSSSVVSVQPTFTQHDGILGGQIVATYYKYSFLTSDTLMGHSTNLILNAPGVLSIQNLVEAGREFLTWFTPLLSNALAAPTRTPAQGNAVAVGFRVSQLNSKAQSMLFYKDTYNFPTTPNWDLPGGGSQQFNSGINLRCVGTSGAGPTQVFDQTNLWLPSAPDSVIASGAVVLDGNKHGAKNWGQTMNDLATYLIGQQARQSYFWGHLGVNQQAPQIGLTSFLNTANVITCTAAVNTFAVGDLIQIKTANSRGWNGIVRVTSITGAVLTLGYKQIPPTAPPTSATATLYYQKATRTYQTIFYSFYNALPDFKSCVVSFKPAVRKPAKPYNPVSFRRGSRLPRTSR